MIVVTLFLVLFCLNHPVSSDSQEDEDDPDPAPDPDAPDPDQVHFFYYTNTSKGSEIIFEDSKSLGKFDPKLPALFIIDGYKSSGDGPMSRIIMKSALAKGRKSNTIVVDWGQLAENGEGISLSQYIRVARDNVPVVGKRLGDMCKFLFKKTTSPKIQFIGFSLGAHVAAAAGEHVKATAPFKITLIVGLDPAGPYFNFHHDKHLKKGHAEHVHIYHTESIFLGSNGVIKGDANIWVNGGKLQPGCFVNPMCSHSYSWEFYAASYEETYEGCPCHQADCKCSFCSAPECETSVPFGDKLPTTASGDYLVVTDKPYFVIPSIFDNKKTFWDDS